MKGESPMKDRRTFIRTLALVAAFVVALLLLAGTYTVIASSAPSDGPAPDFSSGSSSALAWSSNWALINQNETLTFTHNLGGDPDDYAVELWFLDTDGGLGINRRYYGGSEEGGSWYGAHWQNLTTNTIQVHRQPQDTVADRVRIRVWTPLTPTTGYYASPWTDINTGQTITLTHGLGITNTDLTVGLWFSGTTRGTHNYGYGGLAVDPDPPTHTGRMLGTHWHNLTDNTVQVTRHPDDTDVEQVRVVVVHGDPPDYDSLEDLGGWQSIAAGDTFTFTHSLNWDPNMLLVRGECYSSAVGNPGIHQWFAGGNHDWFVGWQGTNLQNLTSNTVTVVRRADDQVCRQVRVRIWKRSVQVYLPLILNNYSSP
jgi:hypothetical protein